MDESDAVTVRKLRERQNTRRTETKTMLVDTGDRDDRGKPIKEAHRVQVYNPKTDAFGRAQAAKAEARILERAHDRSETGRKIKSLRLKMIQAAKAHDFKAEQRFANQIRILEKQEPIES